jgi:hypothetical protein
MIQSVKHGAIQLVFARVPLQSGAVELRVKPEPDPERQGQRFFAPITVKVRS